MRIGLLTCTQLATLLPYDQEVARILSKNGKGLEIEPLVWDDQNIDWTAYDALIFRTTWGYHLKYNEFTTFLDKVKTLNAWNPAEIIRANSHKFYLKELEAKSHEIIPSAFLNRGSKIVLSDLLEKKSWKKAIIKPAISAASHSTWLVTPETLQNTQTNLDKLLQTNDVIIQKFIDEIVSEGEWSNIFFCNGTRYSVLKTPAAGDYRVQNTYGGKYRVLPPPSIVATEAEKVAGYFIDKCLYVRVDGVISDNKFMLMEVELIEPDLYLNLVPEAQKSFADAIMMKLPQC